MTKITEEMLNKAFDNYINAFNELADKEDHLEELKIALDDFKEGSSKYVEAQRDIKAYEATMALYQRKFRMSAVELDRTKVLISMQVRP